MRRPSPFATTHGLIASAGSMAGRRRVYAVTGRGSRSSGRPASGEEQEMGQMLSRRALAGTSATLVAGLALASCGADREGTAGPGAERHKPVRLTYVLHNATKKGVDEKHFPEYKERNPHVDL